MPAIRLTAAFGAIALAGAALFGPAAGFADAGAADVNAAAGPAAAAGHRGIIPPANPSRSLSPVPFFLGSGYCAGGQDGSRCNALAVRAISRARSVLEKIPGMSFSRTAYQQLTPDEQLFVTVNLERTERGLRPVWELTRSLDKIAQTGANDDTDPPLGDVPRTLPGGGHPANLGGNWAGGWINALGADYGWMYDDGGSAWGHRDNILGSYATKSMCGGGQTVIAMGAGHVTKGKAYGDSETELIAGVCGRTPTDAVLTWGRARNLLHIKA